MLSQKALPYVYMCVESATGFIYIGYRFANVMPSTEDLGKHYFTSNNYVKENFEKFEITILAEFFDKVSARNFESEKIKELHGDSLINLWKYKNMAQYKKIEVDNTEKVCAFPGCNRVFRNWRSKCCCPTHSRKYAGLKSRNKI